MTLESRRLGRTELMVSVVGVGTLGFARAGATYEDGVPILKRALDEGVSIIDTALVYGNGGAEKMVGAALKGRRSDCVVVSRCVSREPEGVAADVDKSLQNIGTDYIDVYQLHDVTRPNDVEKAPELLAALKKARDAGKVRFVGVSTHGKAEDVLAMIASGDVDVLTIAYNITGHKRSIGDGEDMSRTAADVLPMARQHDVGVTIMKPLGGGVLARVGPSGQPPVAPVKAIRYVVQNPMVAAVTPGVGTMEEMLENLRAGDPANALTVDEVRALEEKGYKWGLDFCRQCGYCMPCSEGMNLPPLMATYERARAAEDLSAMKAKYAELDVRADSCVECGECESRCPYGLPIQERLKKLHEMLG